MQSKITSFSLANDESAVLYGNFDQLRPVSVHGIGHAFQTGDEAIITLYSLTGMQDAGDHICSADLRLAVTSESLSYILGQLETIRESFFSSKTDGCVENVKTELKKDESAKVRIQEKLSAPL